VPGRPPLRQRFVRAVLVAVALQVVYVTLFVLPGHDPRPNGLPVAVAGALPGAEANGFEVVRVPDEAAARRAILDREVYGAFLPDRVLVSSAASVPVAQLLRSLGRETERVVDVRPTDPDDPRGTTLNLFVLPLIVTGILVALVAAGLLPDAGLRGRVLGAALAALLGSLATVGVVHGAIGALPGSFPALVGVATLGVLALTLSAGGLIALLGQGGVALAFILFLVLGSPASGLAGAPELLPTPWAELGHLLPPGAMGTAIRGVAYFDGAGALDGCLVLVAWCLIGVALSAAARGRRAGGPAAAAPA
jgi:hypothetical protein